MAGKFEMFGGWSVTPATVWSLSPGTGTRHTLIFTYSVNRKPYSSEIRTSQPFVQGQVFPLRYDPGNPGRNELVLRYNAQRIGVVAAILTLVAVLLALYVYGCN